MSGANGECPPLSLSPCPFCGNVDLGIGRGTEDREGYPTYVYCATCGAQGPWIYTRDKGVWTCTALACEQTGWNKSANMLRWLLTGDVGGSSKAMAAHLCGFPCRGDWPDDPDDFSRCLKFLDAVPEARAELPRMAEVNRQWAALVARWDEIETTFHSEMIKPRVWFSAPKTFRLMREVLDEAAKAGKGAE